MPKDITEFPVEYWMVTAQWEELVEIPGAPGLVGDTKKFIRLRYHNTCTKVHPIIHASAMLNGGWPQYCVLFAVPISKYYYDLVSDPSPTEAKVNEIVEKVAAEKAEEEKQEPGINTP